MDTAVVGPGPWQGRERAGTDLPPSRKADLKEEAHLFPGKCYPINRLMLTFKNQRTEKQATKMHERALKCPLQNPSQAETDLP